MKEIKLKVWCKDGKYFINVKDHDYALGFDVDGEIFLTINGAMDKDGYELFPSIGYKDKHNNDIFEGSIVHNPCNAPGNLEIIWSEYNGCWCLGDEDTYPIHKYRPSEFWDVVGHVKENPELLEPK